MLLSGGVQRRSGVSYTRYRLCQYRCHGGDSRNHLLESPGVGTRLATNANCASDLISSGGVNVTGSGTAGQVNDVHVMETEPGSGGSAANGGDTDVTQWLGVGGTGNDGTGNYTV